MLKKHPLAMVLVIALSSTSLNSFAKSNLSTVNQSVSDQEIASQRNKLANQAVSNNFGPQSPRNIDNTSGKNPIHFNKAPDFTKMNLCNIHFHKNAEHKGGEFTKYAGNGDGHGYGSGYRYNGHLSSLEAKPVHQAICPNKHGNLFVGDTIEVHYVHSTAHVKPGPTLGACLNEATKNPQLRVETQVFVLVNDNNALDFNKLTQFSQHDNVVQADNILKNTGQPVEYLGSTTGPGYNEKGSPFQVTWSVRPKVAKVSINSVGQWCKGNVFNEDHGHGVRNLVINPALLSEIN